RASLAAMLGELAEARREDVLEAAADARLACALEHLVQVAAFPEALLERVGIAHRALQLEHLLEDVPPAPHRRDREQDQDALHDDRRRDDQRQERQIGVNVHEAGSSSPAGMRRGRKVFLSTAASVIVASTTVSPPRRIGWRTIQRARPCSTTSTPTARRSPRRAGCRKATSACVTTNTMAALSASSATRWPRAASHSVRARSMNLK